jgi:hypothetical protein
LTAWLLLLLSLLLPFAVLSVLVQLPLRELPHFSSGAVLLWQLPWLLLVWLWLSRAHLIEGVIALTARPYHPPHP